MVALLVVASALFSAAGLALAAVGIGLLMRGDDAWMLGAIGVLPCYAAYLFGRAASRIRRESKANPPTPAQKQARRRRVRDGLVFGVVVAAGSATAPDDHGARHRRDRRGRGRPARARGGIRAVETAPSSQTLLVVEGLEHHQRPADLDAALRRLQLVRRVGRVALADERVPVLAARLAPDEEAVDVRKVVHRLLHVGGPLLRPWIVSFDQPPVMGHRYLLGEKAPFSSTGTPVRKRAESPFGGSPRP